MAPVGGDPARSKSRLALGILLVWLAASVVTASPAWAEPLEMGDESNLVTHLQLQLRDFGFYRGPADGSYGPRTAQAVMAFHKYTGLERTVVWGDADWRFLMAFDPLPMSSDVGVRVDLDRQVLYYSGRDGSVAIVPVSSGSGERYVNASGRVVSAVTPSGEFSFYKHYDGARVSYLGTLWRPWYFYGGYAIHGSSSVPGFPASHGCIRVPNWEADWFASQFWIGMPVTVFRGGPAVQPEIGPTPVMDRAAIMARVD